MATKHKHHAWISTLARETDRKRLASARDSVKLARASRSSARARARAATKRARAAFFKWVREMRAALKKKIAQLRESLRRRIEARRLKLAQAHGREARKALKARHDAAVNAARLELSEMLTARRREHIWTKKNPHAAPVATRSETRSESDHSVEVNLSGDELIVWGRVKSKIKGSDRMSRYEAFQHWLHDNSADVHTILIEESDKAVEQAIRDEERERARMRGPRSARDAHAYVLEELQAVPF